MEQLPAVTEFKESYCQNHQTRQIEYACMEMNQPLKFMCSLCHLKGKSTQNVNNFLLIKEIQENDLSLPIQNWPKNISHDLMDHLYSDRSKCRSQMKQKITQYFKQLQCSIIASIEKQEQQTLNILDDLYDELEQQQENYNKFFLREKLHDIFKNGTYSEELFNQLYDEIQETITQNLEYLEKRKKLADIFENKVFQQPLEISNTINYLLLNIDFFECQELRSIIPNYNKLILNETELSEYKSLIAGQALYQINKSCELQQLIHKHKQIIEYREKKTLFEKHLDSYMYTDVQDILKELKAKENNIFDQLNDSTTKENLSKELENFIISFHQKYNDQKIQNTLSMESKQHPEIIKQLENIRNRYSDEQILVYIRPQIIVERHLQNLYNYITNYWNNQQKFQFDLVASSCGTRPQIENYIVTASSRGQVYFNFQMNKQKTYIVILQIHNNEKSGDLQFGLLEDTDKYFDQQSSSYYNNYNEIYLSTNPTYRSKLKKGVYIQDKTIPKYLEIRVNISKQLFQISDYPSHQNVIQYSKDFSQSDKYKLGLGFNGNSQQIISVEYIEETAEFLQI
ncbi:hypothetical protein ABPG74_013108 [Tetrahymena malaccensis]